MGLERSGRTRFGANAECAASGVDDGRSGSGAGDAVDDALEGDFEDETEIVSDVCRHCCGVV